MVALLLIPAILSQNSATLDKASQASCLFMYFLCYSQTAQHFNFVKRCGGTVVEEKLRVLSISQSESEPSRSDWLNSTKEPRISPLSLLLFFRETLIQGIKQSKQHKTISFMGALRVLESSPMQLQKLSALFQLSQFTQSKIQS